MSLCTIMRDGMAQPCPASVPRTLKVLTATAVSRSASGKRTLADLPPSSSTAGLRDSAHAARIFRAVAGPPVKLTFCTKGWRTSASPVCGPPSTRFTTPSGIPASFTRPIRCSVAYGVSSDGFITTVFPAASAGISFMPTETTGPFQVRMIPTTP
ncbi:Uncharacterised protein [Mycobacterium tuberculosis]|nr:Uncharacterised protein [Mycobacterium tuberculosis]